MVRSWTRIFALPILLVVAAALLSQRAEAADAKSGAKKFVVWPNADLKWAPLAGGPPGVVQATLWGDPTKGAYGGISKFPPTFSAPLHTHPSDHKIVVISGTFLQAPEGKPVVRLGPGSYLMQPAGSYRHTTGCDKASDCVVFIQSDGKFDLIPVDAAKK